MQNVRIYEMPDCRMVSSGVGMFGQEKFDRFLNWMDAQPREMFPRDFLFWEGIWGEDGGFHYVYLYREGMDVPEEFEIIDFKGGLYAVTTDIDQKTDEKAMNAEVDRFLEANGFERDRTRPDLGNIITAPAVREVLGYEQMEYYTPIKVKEK